MQYFTSPRARLFKKRQFRIRHAACALTAVCALSAVWSLTTPEAPAPVMDAAAIAKNPPQLAAVSTPANDIAAPSVPAAAPAPAIVAAPTIIQDSLKSLVSTGSEILVSTKTLTVGKGDTLMDLLVKNNVPRNEAHDAIAALRKVYDPKDLSAGRAITVFFHRDPGVNDPTFKGLQIEKDIVSTVSVNRDNEGAYQADQKEKEIRSETKAFKGKINGSLYVSAKAAGVPDSVILNLIKMYSWNVDFQRDVQSGDSFEVMYDQIKTADGDIVPGKGTILYAKLTLDGRDIPYYRYEDRSGDADYYDETGHSAKKSLMKTPIDGARISSGFGVRKHPVLGFSKMHKGIDFAAPKGTPIYAAGDGKIVKMGPFSSYGNYVRIAHSNGFDTAYAHMNGFKSGLRSGMRVKQGEVIGYVGTTGRSTGAHLHYEIMQNNVAVNPNSVKVPTGNVLVGRDLAALKAFVGQTDRQFDKLGDAPAMAAIVDTKPVKTASIMPVKAEETKAAPVKVKTVKQKQAPKKTSAKAVKSKKMVSKKSGVKSASRNSVKKAGPRIVRAKPVQTASR